MRSERELRQHLANVQLIADNVRASSDTHRKARLDQIQMRWCLGEEPSEYLIIVKRAAALAERIRQAIAAENN